MRFLALLAFLALVSGSLFGGDRQEAELVIENARIKVPVEVHAAGDVAHQHSVSEEITERLQHIAQQIKTTMAGSGSSGTEDTSSAASKMAAAMEDYNRRAKELLAAPSTSASERYHQVNDYFDALREKIASDAAEAGLNAQDYLDSFQNKIIGSGTYNLWSKIRDQASEEIKQLEATASQLRSALSPSASSSDRYSTPLAQRIANIREYLFKTHKDPDFSERLSDILQDLKHRVTPGSSNEPSISESVRHKIATASEYLAQQAEAMRLALSPPQPTAWQRIQSFIDRTRASQEPKPTLMERVSGKAEDLRSKLHDAVAGAKTRVAAATMKERLRQHLHDGVDAIIDDMSEDELTTGASKNRLRVLTDALLHVLRD